MMVLTRRKVTLSKTAHLRLRTLICSHQKRKKAQAVSFLDGLQRVLLFTDNPAIAECVGKVRLLPISPARHHHTISKAPPERPPEYPYTTSKAPPKYPHTQPHCTSRVPRYHLKAHLIIHLFHFTFTFRLCILAEV